MAHKKLIPINRNYNATPSKPKTSKEEMDRMLKEFFARGGVIQRLPTQNKNSK